MLSREDIIKRVSEIQVLTNQTDVNTAIIVQTMVLMTLEEISDRLTAIEMNTVNLNYLLPPTVVARKTPDEPTTPGIVGAAPPAASTKGS